ncbi:MAG: hypothetical protein WD768_13965 [Phycisphaeraceae bacterium]
MRKRVTIGERMGLVTLTLLAATIGLGIAGAILVGIIKLWSQV